MLHDNFDYNSAILKQAIKNGLRVPTTRGATDMTTFPLSLPLNLRTSLANLSTLTGESKAEIIRQAIDKILAQGSDGVIRTNEMQTVERTAKRAGEAAVRAERAARRVQERAVRAARKAQERAGRLADKAEQEDATRRTDELTAQAESAAEREAIQAEANNVPSDPEQTPTDNNHPAQLDRPEPPSPEHVWVRGGTNRGGRLGGGYWRAPKRTKLAI